MSGEKERRRSFDVLLVVAIGGAEQGVWRALSTADHLERALPPLLQWLGFLAVGASVLAGARLGARSGALAALGVFVFGCLMLNDQHTLLGATLVNAAHHAFVPCLLAFFAERLEPAGPSAGRYGRVAAFLLALQLAGGVAPAFLERAALGSIHAVCTLLAVGAAIALGSLRASPAGAPPMPPLARSAYRGAAPKEGEVPTPIAGGLRLVAPVVIPAMVFAFIAAARPRDLSAGYAADFVRPMISGFGAIVFLLGAAVRAKSPAPSPLAIFGGALFLAGLAWTLTRLPATWDLTDAGMMGIVSAMAPLAMTYAVLATRGRAAVVVIGAFYMVITLAGYAGRSIPHHEEWTVMLAIVIAALALVSGVWCVRNAAKLHARFDGGGHP